MGTTGLEPVTSRSGVCSRVLLHFLRALALSVISHTRATFGAPYFKDHFRRAGSCAGYRPRRHTRAGFYIR